MNGHSCQAIVITCIDFRFQDYIDSWLKTHFKSKTYDRGAFAGAAKSLDTILNQVDTARKLHHIRKVVLINHEDCGAYGKEGHVDRHTKDLKNAREKIKQQFSNIEVDIYYLKLNGDFKKII